jgi:hypothetical protein
VKKANEYFENEGLPYVMEVEKGQKTSEQIVDDYSLFVVPEYIYGGVANMLKNKKVFKLKYTDIHKCDLTSLIKNI